MKWRIVDGSGGVHEVAVTSNNGGIPWSASVPEVTRRSYVGERDAVVLVAHAMGWPVAEVLAPGEPTRAELLAENVALRDRAEAAERERDALPEMLRAGVGGTEPQKAAKTDAELREAIAIVKEMGCYSGQTIYRKVGEAFVFARWATQEEDDAYITVFQTGLAAGWRARAERDAVIAAAREYLDARRADTCAVAARTVARAVGERDGWATADDALRAAYARLTAARTRLAALVGGGR